MPEATKRLKLTKPLGAETFNRASHNKNLDEIDAVVQKNIHQGPTAPAGAVDEDLWIDTSAMPYCLKRFSTGIWSKVSPTVAADLGIQLATQANDGLISKGDKAKLDGLNSANYETPSGAQAKADNARKDPSKLLVVQILSADPVSAPTGAIWMLN